jgi:hypothetical protein
MVVILIIDPDQVFLVTSLVCRAYHRTLDQLLLVVGLIWAK